jgi:hypothetical protein
MRYLTPADLIAIHELLMAEFGGMRGITEAGFGRLEAAAAAPQASMFDGAPAVPRPQRRDADCLRHRVGVIHNHDRPRGAAR